MACRRENVTVCDIDGVVYAGPHQRHGPLQGPLRPRTPTRARAGGGAGGRRRLPRPLRPARAQARMAAEARAEAAGAGAGQPGARDPARGRCAPPAPTPSSRPAAATTRTRSTTSSASPSSSAARWTWAPPTINEAMKIAAAEAIASLARVEASEVVAAAYGGAAPVFGPDYIIPKPFDPRLILEIAPAVARAAMESGVARRPIADFAHYRRELERFVFRSGYLMRPDLRGGAAIPAARRLCGGRGRAHAARGADRARRRHRRAGADRPARGDRGARPRHGAADGPRPSPCACSTRRRTARSSIRWCRSTRARSAGAACRRRPRRGASSPAPPSPPPCCWRPGWWTPPSAAAAATG